MKFQNENEYLIHLLNCAIHGTTPEVASKNISLKKVFEIGTLHEVANLAYTALKKIENSLPDGSASWREYYYNSIKRDVLQKKVCGEILNAMHSNGIYTLEVQGTVVKKFYPQSHLRMMTDIDFIIPKDKVNEAAAIMQSLGYETRVKDINGEINASKNQMFIEFHTDYFNDDHIVHKALSNPFSHATLHDDYTATVTDTTFYLFHILHTMKHAVEFRGIGIRRIIDLYFVEEALRDKADLAYIDGILKENNLYEVKSKLMAVKDHWFCGAKPSEEILSYEEEIIKSGNHGIADVYYKNLFKRREENGKHFAKLGYFLEFIFPKKEKVYYYYPELKKRKVPLVFCWIYRLVKSVFSKNKWAELKEVFLQTITKIK